MKLYSFLIGALLLTCQGCDEQDAKYVAQFLNASSPIENYKDARSVFWKSLYPGQTTSLYCGESFNSNQRNGFNVEHVFPMSWAVNGLDCGTRKQCRNNSKQFNLIEADLHNLYPSRSDVNQQRSSHRFGEVSGEKRKFGSHCDFEVDYYKRVAEPAKSVRGEIARSMFYMADRYKSQGLVIFEKQAKMLYKWHKADPPSKAEIQRNNTIEILQGNRNPFIDEPKKLDSLINNGHFF